VRLWDVEGGWLLMTLEDFGGADMNQIAFSPDGTRLAAACRDTVIIYDLTYFDRHIAGNTEHQLRLQIEKEDVDPALTGALRRWSERVMSRRWPLLGGASGNQ